MILINMSICSITFRYVFIVLGGNDIRSTRTPDGIFTEIKRVVDKLKMSGVERVFVSSILERGKTHHTTKMTVKDLNKVRRSLNDRLGKEYGCNYVDTGKRLIYPRHYNKDLVHPGAKEGGLLKLRHAILTAFAKTIPKSVVYKK